MINQKQKLSLQIIITLLIVFGIFLSICIGLSPKYNPKSS